jgi:glutamate-1-semialdehyde 2,1-aminomutase
MNWMTRWPGAFPVVFATAAGAALTDVDGNAYVDFCLGDTGAMAGHSPAPTVAATTAQLQRGITTMLPSEDAGPVGAELGRRFGLRHRQFTLTATDANRFVLRLCREITERPRILVFNHSYHGSVDETFAEIDPAGHVIPNSATSGRRCRSPRRAGWSSSMTSPRWSASWRQATSPACSPSRR